MAMQPLWKAEAMGHRWERSHHVLSPKLLPVPLLGTEQSPRVRAWRPRSAEAGETWRSVGMEAGRVDSQGEGAAPSWPTHWRFYTYWEL